MAKLIVMRNNVKARYATNGRDRCESCGTPIQVGDDYTPTGRSSGKRRLLYCKVCAKEKGIL